MPFDFALGPRNSGGEDCMFVLLGLALRRLTTLPRQGGGSLFTSISAIHRGHLGQMITQECPPRLLL